MVLSGLRNLYLLPSVEMGGLGGCISNSGGCLDRPDSAKPIAHRLHAVFCDISHSIVHCQPPYYHSHMIIWKLYTQIPERV